MEVHKTEEQAEETAVIIQEEQPVKDYPFTEEQAQHLKDKFNDVRANFTTIEELSRKNRLYFEEMHKFIREVHPELLDKDYVVDPTTLKIQLRKQQ